jgi:hypothetical protein
MLLSDLRAECEQSEADTCMLTAAMCLQYQILEKLLQLQVD